MIAFLLALLLARGDETPLHWAEKRLDPAALPADLPEPARLAVEAWYPWSRDHAYKLDLDRTGRVLLITRESNDRIGQQLEFVDQVLARFEGELPPPAARLEVPVPGAKKKEPEPPPVAKGEPVPEDPEGEDHPWKLAPTKPAERTSAAPTVTTWGAQGAPPDSQTVVLFVVRDQDDFVALLKHLASKYPYLAAWSAEAKVNQGFVLGEPCVGAYLELPDGVEEWDPDNELVHRIARLLVLNRYGELPNWFLLGYAWHLEIALRKGVYCFPWRDEFVWATEHGGWPSAARARYAKERIKPADFMGFVRGKYIDEMAKASWAMAAYLVAKEHAKLPALLEEVRVYRLEHGRIAEGEDRWRKDTEYEIPVSEQAKLFTKHLGEGYLQRASVFVRQEAGK
jgi:hypothetical protein